MTKRQFWAIMFMLAAISFQLGHGKHDEIMSVINWCAAWIFAGISSWESK